MRFAHYAFKFGVLAAILVLPAAANVSAQTPLELKDGQVAIDGQLDQTDAADTVRKQPCKVYTVDLKANQAYQIDMKSKAIDSYLRLEDAALKELAHDDDSGGFPDARIIFKCTTEGKYRIIATTFAGGTGAFNLSVKQIAEPKAVEATEIVLKDGKVEVASNLTNDDPKDKVRVVSPCKIYAIKLTAGKTYQIDMMSKAIDSYLRFEDAAGKELAHDDDSGEGLDARIIFNCTQEGTYRIIATTFLGGTGPFTLRVTEK